MTWLDAVLADPPDWQALTRAFPHAGAMAACPQDAVYHAEGDVWTHTGMVLEALRAAPGWDILPAERREALTLTALLHDVAKPLTTEIGWDEVEKRERVRQPGHASRGARMAWQMLFQAGVPLARCLEVTWLIAWHQKVFHLWTATDMLRQAITFSLLGRWDDLVTFAEADNRGRIAPNCDATAEQLALLRLWLDEQGVLAAPWAFADEASVREYLEKPDRSPHYAARPPQGSRVVVMSGLPGSGKDTYVRQVLADYAVVSLDDIRRTLKIGPEEDQGRVIQAGFEEARRHLRTGEAFVWNATGLTRTTRGKIIGIARDYDAHVAIHALDTPLAQVLRQNRSREARVPDAVMDNLIAKWEPPGILEAHAVEWLRAGKAASGSAKPDSLARP